MVVARKAIAVLMRLGKRLCFEPTLLLLGRDFLFIASEFVRAQLLMFHEGATRRTSV